MEASRAFSALVHLEQMYPGFEDWYWGKVVPGLSNGTRQLFIEERGSRIIAAVIAKAEGAERKLCTVWVHPAYTGQKIGVRLMDEAKSWLGTNKPMISVPEERVEEFRSIFIRWGFELTQVLDSYYRPGRKELVFNGILSSR